MLGLLIVAAIAGEPLFKPTGKYATSAPDSRTTPTNDVPSPSRPVVRESVRNIVYVVGSTTCPACVYFEQKHGKGNSTTEYRYAKLDLPRPANIDAATWNQCVAFSNSGRFLWPFFMARVDNEFIAVQARVDK